MFDDIIAKYALRFNVPEVWIKAVIRTESNFDPEAYRAEPQIQDASYGLMQLLYGTARGLGFTGSANDLYDPDTNIRLGTQLLSDLQKRYGDDFRRIYSAYNSGNPDRWQTSSQVRANVERALRNLEYIIKNEPLIVTGGAVGGIVLLVLLWYWGKRK